MLCQARRPCQVTHLNHDLQFCQIEIFGASQLQDDPKASSQETRSLKSLMASARCLSEDEQTPEALKEDM